MARVPFSRRSSNAPPTHSPRIAAPSQVQLKKPPAPGAPEVAAAAAAAALESMLAAPPSSPDEIAFAQQTAAAVAVAVADLAVKGKHELLADVAADIN